MATVAISAGHTRGTGARAHDGIREWEWNMGIVRMLETKLVSLGHKVVVLHRDSKLGYGKAMKKLAKQMRRAGADCCVELHFNYSSNRKAKGFEFLYWWGSGKGKRFASCLSKEFSRFFPKIKGRGKLKGVRSLWFFKRNIKKAYHGRGGAYVYRTPCPAVICEPCFASNPSDWSLVKHQRERVAQAYAIGIDQFLNP